MTEFKFSLHNRDIFRQQSLWFSVHDCPKFNDEFDTWMTTTFGRRYDRWHSRLDGKMVRSSRGAGNRGGWEWKPFFEIICFKNDGDAIFFKMQWGDRAVPS